MLGSKAGLARHIIIIRSGGRVGWPDWTGVAKNGLRRLFPIGHTWSNSLVAITDWAQRTRWLSPIGPADQMAIPDWSSRIQRLWRCMRWTIAAGCVGSPNWISL